MNRRLPGSLAAILLLVLPATLCVWLRAPAQDAAVEPLGVRWLTLPQGTKLETLLSDTGELIEQSRGDLERRLRKLQAARESQKTPPRVLKTSYRADLVGNALVGSGEWLVDHVGQGPAILPAPELSFAVVKPRLDGRDAILGDLDGQHLGLWVEKQGKQTLTFEWSQRGALDHSGTKFDLHLPPAPRMALDLRLPADQILSVPRGTALVSGPHPSDNPAWKSWHIEAAGRSQLELQVQRGNETGRPAVVLVSRDTRVQFSPEVTYFEHDYQLEVLHAPVNEFVFEMDAALEPYEVTAKQTPLAGWKTELMPPANDKARPRSRLRVQLREPFVGILPRLRIRSTAPRWPDKETPLFDVAIVRGIHRGETLKLYFHSDQALERWDPGSFRIIQLTTENDGGQTIGLVDTNPDGRGRRPIFALRAPLVEFAVRQENRWRLTAHGSELTSTITYDVSRGRLFDLQLRLPKTGVWQVADIVTEPTDALRKWGVAGNFINVELAKSASPRTDLKLKVRMQSKEPTTKTRVVDFPDLEPLGAALRQGSLAIVSDGPYQVGLVSSSQATSRPPPTDPLVDYFFSFRQTPLTGKLRLVPQAPVVQVHTKQEIVLTAERATTDAQLTVQPVLGQPAFVDLWLTGAREPFQVDVTGAELRGRERLYVRELAPWALQLGAPSPIARAFARTVYPQGEAWRLHFREPIQQEVTLRVRYGSPRQQGRVPEAALVPMLPIDGGLLLALGTVMTRTEQRGILPIVLVPNAEWTDGEVILQPTGVAVTRVLASGLEAQAVATTAGGTFARSFRFREGGGLPSLNVSTAPRFGLETAQAVLDQADLITSVDKVGNVVHHLQVSVWNWRGREFPVLLPTGSAVLAARLNGVDLDRVPFHIRPEGSEVLVPIGPAASAQWLELTYRIGGSRSWGLLGVDATTPDPKLPIPPAVWRRRLRLDPAWVPLHQERFASLDRRALGQDMLRRLWRVGEGLAEELLPSTAPTWIEEQRVRVLTAEVELRKSLPAGVTLGEALGRLLFDGGANRDPFVMVLDRFALRAAGITPRTVLAEVGNGPFWESARLAYVPTPRGALLTSRDRAETWATAVRQGTAFGALLAGNVGRAAEFGQDGSGRFCAADHWLRTEPSRPRSPIALETLSPETSFWQPLDADATDMGVMLHRTRIRWAAAFGALGVFAGCWWLRRWISPALFFRAVWVGLAIGVVTLLIAPWALWELSLGPLTALVVFLIIAYRDVARAVPPSRPRPARSTQKALQASLGGLLMAVVVGAVATAGASQERDADARIVYLLSDDTGAATKAFVRPQFMRWLEAAEKDVQPTTADVVFRDARYQGRWDGDRTLFQAEFDLHAYRGKTNALVPLVGVELLEGTSLDGTAVFPTVAPSGKIGYQIDLAQAGPHRLSLNFAVRPTAAGELKFGIPPTTDSRLRWTMPARFGQLQSLKGVGAETLRRDFKKDEQVLDLQLGHENQVHLHWTAAGTGGGPGNPRVRELYFFDMRAGQRSALALLAYQPTSAISQVEVHLPPLLEPRAVEVLDADGKSAAFKGWRPTGPEVNRVLQVELLRPTTTPFQALLSLVPRGGAPGRSELKLPLPLKAAPVEGEPPTLAFRLDETEFAERRQALGWTGVPVDRFIKDWRRLSQRELPTTPQRAYTIGRDKANAPLASVELTEIASPPHVESMIGWTLQPQAVDLASTFKVRSADGLFVVPVRLPAAIVLRDVQGADVHHWSRLGESLQIWLTGPRKETSFSVLGWFPTQTVRDKQMTLPLPTLPATVADSTTMVLDTATNLALFPKSPVLTRLMKDEAGGRRIPLPEALGSAECVLKPQVSTPTYEVLTTASVQGGVASLAAHLHGRLAVGDYPELRIRIKGWPGGVPRLLAPGFAHKSRHSKNGVDDVWIVTLPPGTPQQVTFSIGGRFAVKPGQRLTVPEVSIEAGGDSSASRFALVGAEPVGKKGTDWLPMARPREELAAWPIELGRLQAARALFVTKAPGAATLAFQPRENPTTAPAKVLDARHLVVPAGADRWLHRMSWDISTSGAQELEVGLPADGHFTAAFVQGQAISPRLVAGGRLMIPLPASDVPMGVEVWWTYPTVSEPMGKPRTSAAHLVDLEAPATRTELFAPAGWRVAEPEKRMSLADSLVVEVRLRQQALTALADGTVSSAATKTLFDHAVREMSALMRHATYRIRLAERGSGASGGDAKRVATLLEEQRHLARKLGLESPRQKAERRPWDVEAPLARDAVDVGTPAAWRPGDAGDRPTFALQSVTDVLDRRLREIIAAGLALMLAIIVLSYWPAGLRRWVRLWPEQLAAATGLAFWWQGFSLLGCGFLLIALLGRAILTVRWLSRLLARRRQPAPSQAKAPGA
jgi:hypothetical protein